MKHTIICVGKIKERYFTEAIAEYRKRISRYDTIDIIEVADEKIPKNASLADEEHVKETEGSRIIAKIPQDSYVIGLVIEGTSYDSVGFSQHLESLNVQGISGVIWIIGGSLGLSQHVMGRLNERVSFSEMTFPHQLMRVILLEQIYRACRIRAGEPYHK